MGGCGSSNKETMKINQDRPNVNNVPKDNIICMHTLTNGTGGSLDDDFESNFTKALDDTDLSAPLWQSFEDVMFERMQDEDYFDKDEISLEKQGFHVDLFKQEFTIKIKDVLGKNYSSAISKHGYFKVRPVEFKETGASEDSLELRKLCKHGDFYYFGQWNKDSSKPEGRGIAIYSNGAVYEGLWYSGMRHATGRLVYPSDGGYSVYQGTWLGDSTSD